MSKRKKRIGAKKGRPGNVTKPLERWASSSEKDVDRKLSEIIKDDGAAALEGAGRRFLGACHEGDLDRWPAPRETARSVTTSCAISIASWPNGACLYALKGGEWGCYTIKPSAAETFATAEGWLDKRDCEGWG